MVTGVKDFPALLPTPMRDEVSSPTSGRCPLDEAAKWETDIVSGFSSRASLCTIEGVAQQV